MLISTHGSGVFKTTALAASSCSYSLSSTSLSTGAAAAAGNVNVTTTSGCTWTAVSNASWISVTSGASGSGNGSVSYSVAANTDTSSRTGTLTIAGQTFTVTQAAGSGGGATTNLLVNPGFESGATGWSLSSSGGYNIISLGASWAHTGSYYAWLCGYYSCTDAIYQSVTIPANAQTAYLQFWHAISTNNRFTPEGTMAVELYSASGAKLITLKPTLSNLDAPTGWVQSAPFDVSAYKGQTVQLRFTATTNNYGGSTSFMLDDVSLTTSTASSPPSCTMTASPATITTGATSTLTATCTPSTGITYAWTGLGCAANTTNTCIVTPSVTTAYTVTGTNAAGAGAAATATVTVVPPTPVCTLTVTPAYISAGGSSTLTAGCTPAATSYAWTNSGFASTVSSGTVAPSTTTIYSVIGSNISGSGNKANAAVIVGTAVASQTDVRNYVPAASFPSGYVSYLRVINTGSAATPVSVARIDGATGAVGASGILTPSLAVRGHIRLVRKRWKQHWVRL